MRVASAFVVFAKPKASEASPNPVRPASVRSRTISHTVRSVARTGSSSKPVTRSRGAASSQRGTANAAVAAPHEVRNARRLERIRVEGMVSQRVNAERVMLLAWPRAILMQVAHPLVAAGVAEHSTFADGGVTAAHRLWQT